MGGAEERRRREGLLSNQEEKRSEGPTREESKEEKEGRKEKGETRFPSTRDPTWWILPSLATLGNKVSVKMTLTTRPTDPSSIYMGKLDGNW
ncbi:hypothetical protein ACFX1T_046959 [Malus domestica]